MRARGGQVRGGSCLTEHTPCYLRKWQAVTRPSNCNHSQWLFKCCSFQPLLLIQLFLSLLIPSFKLVSPPSWLFSDSCSLLFPLLQLSHWCYVKLSLFLIPKEHNGSFSLNFPFHDGRRKLALSSLLVYHPWGKISTSCCIKLDTVPLTLVFVTTADISKSSSFLKTSVMPSITWINHHLNDHHLNKCLCTMGISSGFLE